MTWTTMRRWLAKWVGPALDGVALWRLTHRADQWAIATDAGGYEVGIYDEGGFLIAEGDAPTLRRAIAAALLEMRS